MNQQDTVVRAAALAPQLDEAQGAAPPVSGQRVKKRTKVRAALLKRARAEIGVGATGLDHVCAWVARGGRITDLAREIATDIGESCSPSFLSLIINRLGPDATPRIMAARRDGVPPIQSAVTAMPRGLFDEVFG
jgi:hypothetical protein